MSFSGFKKGVLATAFLLSSIPTISAQQTQPAPPRSVPVSNIRYDLTFDSTTARDRIIKVAMSFDVGGNGRCSCPCRAGPRAPMR